MSPEQQDILHRIACKAMGKQTDPVSPEELKELYTEAICAGDVAFIIPVRPQSAFRSPLFSRDWEPQEIQALLYREIHDEYKSAPQDMPSIQDYFELNYTQAAFLLDQKTGMVACIFDYQKSDIYTVMVMDTPKFCVRYAAYIRDNLDRINALTEDLAARVDCLALHLATEKQKAILVTIDTVKKVTGIAIPHPLRDEVDASASLKHAAGKSFPSKENAGTLEKGEDAVSKIVEQYARSQKFKWN